MEREKARVRAAESPSSTPAAARVDDAAGPASRRDGSVSEANHPTADDNESLAGDILNAVGSASSHTSTASSVFSSTALQSGTTVPKASGNSFTPLSTADSPSYAVGSTPHKPKTSTPQYPERADEVTPKPRVLPNGTSGPSASSAVVRRVPARDPNRLVMGIICTYDPMLDKTLSSTDKRKAKPIYKEFGPVRIPTILLTQRGERRLTYDCLG